MTLDVLKKRKTNDVGNLMTEVDDQRAHYFASQLTLNNFDGFFGD